MPSVGETAGESFKMRDDDSGDDDIDNEDICVDDRLTFWCPT